MSSPSILLGALAVSLIAVSPAAADRPRHQQGAYHDAQRGKIMSLPKIEKRAREHPAVRGATYLGPEYDEGAATYRLKFMRAGRVIFIDLDARTGRVLQTSGD